GRTVVLNPAPFQPVPAELLASVDVLVPNEVELRQMVPDAADLTEAALAVHDQAGCVVVVTCGELGLVVVQDGRARQVPGHRVQAVDTIGSGDAFCGTLGARLALGDPLGEALDRANAAAALSVTRPGGAPSVPTADEVVRFLAEVSAR